MKKIKHAHGIYITLKRTQTLSTIISSINTGVVLRKNSFNIYLTTGIKRFNNFKRTQYVSI